MELNAQRVVARGATESSPFSYTLIMPSNACETLYIVFVSYYYGIALVL